MEKELSLRMHVYKELPENTSLQEGPVDTSEAFDFIKELIAFFEEKGYGYQLHEAEVQVF